METINSVNSKEFQFPKTTFKNLQIDGVRARQQRACPPSYV